MEAAEVEMDETTVAAITAEVESSPADYTAQIAEMDRRLQELENAIGDLRTVKEETSPEPVQASAAGRKTHSAMLIVKGAAEAESTQRVPMAALDAALTSLSLEQRIAVKSRMAQAGLL